MEEKQKKGVVAKNFIGKFRNLSLRCPEGMPLSMLLQTCRHNLCAEIESNMCVVWAHSWKEFQEQAKIIEKLISRILTEDKGKQRVESTLTQPPSKVKGKNVLVLDNPTEPKMNPPPQQNTSLAQ